MFERQGESGTWHNAQVSKTYKEDGEYKRTNSFSRNDLLKLNALLPQAITRMLTNSMPHSFIARPEPSGPRPGRFSNKWGSKIALNPPNWGNFKRRFWGDYIRRLQGGVMSAI